MTDRNRENCQATHDLDLRDSALYVEGIEWLRNNVVLRNTITRDVLQLNVLLPRGAVTLYMAPRDHYIMGFRGADAIYLLKDRNQKTFKKALETEIEGTRIEILENLSTSHTAKGLKTFTDTASGVPDGRVFTRTDLDNAANLAKWRVTSDEVDDETKTSLSLLVCMLAESARIPMMEYDFKNMLYYGMNVWADHAAQSFRNAKYLIRKAKQLFPNYPRALGVEKVYKRATEMRELFDRINDTPGYKNRSTLMARLVGGKITATGPAAGAISRFIFMYKELRVFDAMEPSKVVVELSELIDVGGNQGAARAAIQGVAVPDIGKEISAQDG